MARKRLESVFIELNLATEKQVAECQRAVAGSTRSFVDCLIEKQYVSPENAARTYATYATVPLVERIDDKMADPALLAKVPMRFLRENVVIPLMHDGEATLVTANPLDFQPLDEIRLLLGSDLRIAVAAPALIVDGINRYYPLEGAKQMIEELEGEEETRVDEAVDFESIGEGDLLSAASEAPIIKLVNHILLQAVKRGASDIHIEPFEKALRVRYRIDGVMYDVMNPPKRVQGPLSSRMKIMAHLDIAEKRMPQDGRIQIKVADKAFDIRVSVLPVVHGERIVMRLLDKTKSHAALEELGLSERDYRVLTAAIARPNGIIYVTGPTGSGKTTTLYSVLSSLSSPEVNIVTVEDPVEYQMAGVGQVQVREKIGMTFAAALRAILRQDPDVIMIGETRDRETAQIAIQSSLTGHLVLSTLHTNNAPAAITRLIDMDIEPFLISSTVVLILAQRLVRRLCTVCKKEYTPDADVLKRLGVEGGDAKRTFFEPVGCDECMHTGYKGRLAVFEMMEMTDGIVRATMQRSDTATLRTQAVKDGMTLLIQDGLRKIEAGLTSVEEVLSVAVAETETIE